MANRCEALRNADFWVEGNPHSEKRASAWFRSLRIIIGCIGFAVSVLMFALCVIEFVVPFYGGGTFGGFLGAILMLFPCLLWMWSEWQALYHHNTVIERRLGKAYIMIAIFLAFGVVANVGEAISDRNWSKNFGMVFLVLTAMATYFGIVGGVRSTQRIDWIRHRSGPLDLGNDDQRTS